MCCPYVVCTAHTHMLYCTAQPVQVEETLQYTAELRLEPGLTREERAQRVDKVLEQVSKLIMVQDM